MYGAARCVFLGVSLCALWMARAEAEVIVAYETLNPEVGDVSTSEAAPHVQPLALRRGPGLSAASGATFNTRGWTTEGTIDPEDYLEWGWNGSDFVDLAALDVRYDRSSSGPAQLEIQLAVNGGPFEQIFADADVDTSGESQLGIDLSRFGGVLSATFRLFGYSAGRSSGTFDLENYSTAPNRAIMVSGTTSAVPEPGMLALIGSLGVGFVVAKTARRLGKRHRGRAS